MTILDFPIVKKLSHDRERVSRKLDWRRTFKSLRK